MIFNRNKKRSGKTEQFTDLIRNCVQRYGWDEIFAVELIRDEWETIVGTLLSSHSKPLSLAEKSLLVCTDHPVYSNELSLMIPDVVRKINDKMGAEIIDAIKIEQYDTKRRTPGKYPRKR